MLNSRTSMAQWLWVHNPFYVISALLMLYGVRAGYGKIDIGTIDCWMMMVWLGAYTLILAVVGVMIVRWGEVWDDSRSILLVLLLLFLAVSVSADDLFVKMESVRGGAVLMFSGFGFSIGVLLGVLRAARIRLSSLYVVPLVLFLALFFFAPWWCSPELHPKDAITLDWTLFLFPQVAAVLLLTLLPAVRMGQKSIEGNGTPWQWPLFPWSAFFMIGIAVVLRSYALTMTFSQSGPIWKSPDSRIGIVFDTIWRPYFLVPFALAVFVLVIEAGLTSGNRRMVGRALRVAPGSLVLAWPWSPSDAMMGFLNRLTSTVGSPVWLTIWLLIAFYGWAMIRRIPGSGIGLLASVVVLSVIDTKTISVSTLTPLNPWPLQFAGIVLGIVGIRRRSSSLILAASGLATAGIWAVLPQTPLAEFRATTCYHVMLAVCLLLSVVGNDVLAKRLQLVAAISLFVSSIMVLNASSAVGIPWAWRFAYVVALAMIAVLCAYLCNSRVYWLGLVGTIGAFGNSLTVEGYRSLAATVGRNAVAAFSWSAGTLILGFLISAQKANWLPILSWNHFTGHPLPQSDIRSAIVQQSGESDANDQ